MKRATLALLLLVPTTPARAHDHQWHYNSCEWQADLARGQELARLIDCDAALLYAARQQFAQMDQQILARYRTPDRRTAPSPISAPLPRP
jgi:hypothetical protein